MMMGWEAGPDGVGGGGGAGPDDDGVGWGGWI